MSPTTIGIIGIAVMVLIFFSRMPVAYVMTLIGFLGFSIMIRAWWLFQQHETAICPTAETTSFIVSDIYRLTRNPMYLGMIMILIGIALLVGSWPYYFVTILYAVILNHVFCPYEERKLLDQYGAEYADYTLRVRRWI